MRVVCFGDSTTAPRKDVVTYCEQLAQRFLAEQVVFINRGVPGNTTADARKRFEADVLQLNPNLVFIQFGINDSSVDIWKKPPAKTPRVSLDEYSKNLLFFIEAIQRRGSEVVLITFNPVVWSTKTLELYGRPPYDPDNPNGFNAGREAYLDTIHSMADRSKITLLDVHDAYRKYASVPGRSLGDLLPDGMHPNSTGQQITAELARPAVVKLLARSNLN